MAEPIIQTCEGKIKGMVTKNHNGFEYYTFKGIPYAKPPIGELRFAIPEPAEPWDGIRDGTQDCNICAQYDKITGHVVGSEDCLFLNVYTPKLPSKNIKPLPVMVFFHGGGFVFGNGTDSTKHGPEFIVEKDVILVSFNYRVGILGFLALGLKEAPGNMGLRDQVLALSWVNKNISHFGGDPEQVTIFGISAGGASVEYLLLAPSAEKYFQKAIAQSGSSLLPWAQNSSNNIRALAAKIPSYKGEIVAEDAKLLQYLKSLPIDELILSSMKAISEQKFKGGIYFGFVPTIEKAKDWTPFMKTDSTYHALRDGEYTRVPFISGICTREGLLTVSHSKPILDDLVEKKNFLDHFPFELVDNEKDIVAAQLKSVYLEGEHVTNDTEAFAIDFFTDTDFFGGVYTAAKLINKHNPVHFYEFSYDGALNYLKKTYGIDRKGACHGDEGGYLLKNDNLTENISETDEFIQQTLLDFWTNFAKSSDPNTSKNGSSICKGFYWEEMSKLGGTMVIDKKPHMKYNIYKGRADFYTDMYDKKNRSTS